jgi:phosphopantetheinyl transferase (holo-ACP synthase)
MNYIGNDILSLKSKQNLQSFSNPKYITKVLNNSEIMLTEGINLALLTSLCWSIKESAYKVLVKTGFEITFAPKMFTVNVIDMQQFIKAKKSCNENLLIPEIKVTAYGLNFYSFPEITGEYMHSVSSLKKDDQVNIYRNVREIRNKKNESKEAVSFLLEAIAEKTGACPDELDLMKNERNIPILMQKGLPLNIDVSLSHDGNYVSYAFLAK